MFALMLCLLLGAEDTTNFVPYRAGGQGSGIVIRGDADASDLASHYFPPVPGQMTEDTSTRYEARVSLEVTSSGVVGKKPVIIKSSSVEEWDSTITETLQGWVFVKSEDSLRRVRVQLYYKPPKKVKFTSPFGPSEENGGKKLPISGTVADILSDAPNLEVPSQSSVPLGMTFTLSGKLEFDDLLSYQVPDLISQMQQQEITQFTARFRIKVNSEGEVQEITVVQSSGKTSWDRKLEQALYDWEFTESSVQNRTTEVIFLASLE